MEGYMSSKLASIKELHTLNDDKNTDGYYNSIHFFKHPSPTPSTECKHEFVDVYDYKDEQHAVDHIITKKYILTYCKVCGYTINRPCTE